MRLLLNHDVWLGLLNFLDLLGLDHFELLHLHLSSHVILVHGLFVCHSVTFTWGLVFEHDASLGQIIVLC